MLGTHQTTIENPIVSYGELFILSLAQHHTFSSYTCTIVVRNL